MAIKKKIILTGGGTAGHVTPNIAMIERLGRMGLQVEYIGSDRGIEKTLLANTGISFHSIDAGKLRRYFDWQNFIDIFRVGLGFIQSLWLMFDLRPELVFSKGGFVSTPVVWAAWLFRIPVIIHESDSTPGLANRLALPFANKICYSFPETIEHLPGEKAIYTGIPVREDLLHGNADLGRELVQFKTGKPVLLVIGGSLGSEIINQTVRNALEDLLTAFNVIHICGSGRMQETLTHYEGYRQFEYLHDQLKHVLAITDLVISRAGATMLFELLALKKPALLIPLSLKASRGDQILNARSFERQGYSMVLQEDELNKKTLLRCVEKLHSRRNQYIDAMVTFNEEGALHQVLAVIEEQLEKD